MKFSIDRENLNNDFSIIIIRKKKIILNFNFNFILRK